MIKFIELWCLIYGYINLPVPWRLCYNWYTFSALESEFFWTPFLINENRPLLWCILNRYSLYARHLLLMFITFMIGKYVCMYTHTHTYQRQYPTSTVITSRSVPTDTPITIPAISPTDNTWSSSSCGVGDGETTNIILVTVNPAVEKTPSFLACYNVNIIFMI